MAAAGALAIASPLAAQAVTDPTKPSPPAAPAKAAQGPPSPFTFTVTYNADLLDEVAGEDPGPGYVDLLKLSAAYDGGVAGHDGLTGLVSVEHAFGSDFTQSRVGGLQNI